MAVGQFARCPLTWPCAAYLTAGPGIILLVSTFSWILTCDNRNNRNAAKTTTGQLNRGGEGEEGERRNSNDVSNFAFPYAIRCGAIGKATNAKGGLWTLDSGFGIGIGGSGH